MRRIECGDDNRSPFHGYRFPSAIISYAVHGYHRFNLSLRDIEELLLERGVTVTYESVRHWCDRFGVQFAHCAKAMRRRPGSTWHLDERFCRDKDGRARTGPT